MTLIPNYACPNFVCICVVIILPNLTLIETNFPIIKTKLLKLKLNVSDELVVEY